MTDLSAIFAPNDADVLTGLLGHSIEEAAAWWLGADLAGINPGLGQELLVARRMVRGHAVCEDALEISVAAICAYLLPIAGSLTQIDALHDDLAVWLAPMLDERSRTRVIARAAAALDILDAEDTDRNERLACIDAIQATGFDIVLDDIACSINVVRDPAGQHILAIVAAPVDKEEDLLQIGKMAFPTDGDDGRSGRSITPVAPVPLNA